MIYDLSVRLTSRLGKRGYLPDSEEEIIAYGLFSLLSKLMYAVICLILGLIFSVPLESMISTPYSCSSRNTAAGFTPRPRADA